MSLRAAVDPAVRIVERVLARGGPSRVASAFRRGSGLVLAYHNIIPDALDGVGERSLHLMITRFREQLDALHESHEIVPLAALIDPARSNGRPKIAITFDDAYRGCLEVGLTELQRRGLPCTIFVAPGIVGRDGCWWDLLADPMSGTLAEADREHILKALDGDGDRAVAWARSRGQEPNRLPELARIATEAEIVAASKLPGVVIGAHSWTHRHLPSLAPAELARELRPPLDWLRARIPGTMPWLAYPYGLHSPSVTEAARRSGYEAVLRIFGGWCSRREAAAGDIPRLNIPAAIRTDRFVLMTRGMLPL